MSASTSAQGSGATRARLAVAATKVQRGYQAWQAKREQKKNQQRQAAASAPQQKTSSFFSRAKDKASSTDTSALAALSIFLFIFGFLHHFTFRFYLPNATRYHEFAAWIFLLVGTYTFFLHLEDRGAVQDFKPGLAALLGFLIWYRFLGAKPSTLIPIVIVLAIYFGYLGVTRKSEGFAEIAVGLIPVMIFFLDISLIEWIHQYFNWTINPILNTLIINMPWWALLGFLSFPQKVEEKGSAGTILVLAKIGFLLYLFFVFSIPFTPIGHFDQSVIPSPTETLEVGSEFLQKARPEPRIWSVLNCLGDTEVSECIELRQEKSSLRALCKADKQVKGGITTIEECIAREEKNREKILFEVAGILDPTLKEPTTAKFKRGDFFPDSQTWNVKNPPLLQYPITLDIKNPREEKITVDFSCEFSLSSFSLNDKAISGEITSPTKTYTTSEPEDAVSVVCRPPRNLITKDIKNGKQRMKLTYTAQFHDLYTSSRLQRAFIGEVPLDKKGSLINNVVQLHFRNNEHLSQAPADFAQINFAFGNPLNSPIVEPEDNLLSSTIKNAGRGEITVIKEYRLDLPGFFTDHQDCLFDTNVPVPESAHESIYLPTCIISSLPLELEDPEMDYALREFEASLVYDYKIKHEANPELLVMGQAEKETEEVLS